MLAINKFIKFLISADLMFNMASGFINPVFAIFIIDSIQGGTIKVAGTAAAVYWITKSILRIPIAYFLDKIKGDKDDYYAMTAGFTLFSFAHFLYVFAHTTAHIYIIQVIMGIGGAFAFTPWYGLFSKHIDKHHENFEWGIEISFVGIGMALAGYLSGIIAEDFGFNYVFMISGLISLLGVVLLTFIKNTISRK